MRMIFKQRMFTWFDTYDIYDEAGGVLYTVKGQMSWGHCLKIFDQYGAEVGTVKQQVLSMMPRFELYVGEDHMGTLSRKFTPFHPSYDIDFNGWKVDGDFLEWDYTIVGDMGGPIATISKELLRWTDTYVIDVVDPRDALMALMLVLAIDAEKCSRSND